MQAESLAKEPTQVIGSAPSTTTTVVGNGEEGEEEDEDQIDLAHIQSFAE